MTREHLIGYAGDKNRRDVSSTNAIAQTFQQGKKSFPGWITHSIESRCFFMEETNHVF